MVARVQHTDYPLSKPRRRWGYTLLCAHTAASSELTLETLEASGPQDIAVQQIVTTLRQVRAGARHARAAPADAAQPPPALSRRPVGDAGLSGREEGDDLHRTLPVASCPATTATCTSSSAATSDAFARRSSPAPCAPATPSTCGAGGDFVLESSERPLVFAACDLGFAPVKSLIDMRWRATRRPRCRCSGWRRGPTATSWPTSAARGRPRWTASSTSSPTQRPGRRRARWRRRCAPTCSTSPATSTSPGRRPSCKLAPRRVVRGWRAGRADHAEVVA